MEVVKIMFNFLKKTKEQNEYLLEWQNTVMIDKSDKLYMTKNQLISITKSQALRDMEIIDDCIRLVKETKNVETFFGRLELLENKSIHLSSLEKYLDFTGAKPSQALQEFNEEKQIAIKEFLIRYFTSIMDKMDNLKTERGKINQIQKFYNSLTPYFDLMNEENIEYIRTKYKAYTRTLNK